VERNDYLCSDAGWPRAFDAERQRIAAALGGLARRIEHNGSTAVPGLAAKPIIDIQVSVDRVQPLEPYAVPLSSLGYVHMPHPDDAFCPFFHRPESWPHTHHVHVVEAGGGEERRTLAFRDYLRDHDDVAREYETLKRELIRRHNLETPAGREGYAIAKSDFIERMVQLALTAGYGDGAVDDRGIGLT
jgi:GrpB-like predicted nucleotidyltransferase (UPF0157 family)